MGRIADLCGEIAAAADEGPEGLVLAAEDWDRLRREWRDEDIEDALAFVHDSMLQSELVESADSLSAKMVDVLGAFGEAARFEQASTGGARLEFELLGQLARRVARLEETLEAFRDAGTSPDRRGFDALRRRLADYGIEKAMRRGRPPGLGRPEPLRLASEDDPDDE